MKFDSLMDDIKPEERDKIESQHPNFLRYICDDMQKLKHSVIFIEQRMCSANLLDIYGLRGDLKDLVGQALKLAGQLLNELVRTTNHVRRYDVPKTFNTPTSAQATVLYYTARGSVFTAQPSTGTRVQLQDGAAGTVNTALTRSAGNLGAASMA
ncbi:hypothetical protein BKA93DRAFT_772550 [Sparassis latifolia]